MTSLTISDRNLEMIKLAQLKYQKEFRQYIPKAVFQLQDAESLTYESQSFDTVIDTFGLCACEDPIRALREMARVTKPDGRILLLEHGRGKYPWLNEILDKDAMTHAKVFSYDLYYWS